MNKHHHLYLFQDTIAVNGQSTGPFDLKTLENMIDKGEFNKENFVWKKGMSDWEKAETIDELKALFVTIPPIPNEK